MDETREMAEGAYNAGDGEHVRARREKEKTRELRKRAALHALMATPDGRAWMWDLICSCGAYRSSFSSEALVMAFNEGRRDIGNSLICELNRLDGGCELYVRMTVEQGRMG